MEIEISQFFRFKTGISHSLSFKTFKVNIVNQTISHSTVYTNEELLKMTSTVKTIKTFMMPEMEFK